MIYAAIIISGGWDGFSENYVFVSFNKNKVENWCKRFNKIISDNTDRIENKKTYCFWHDFIKYEHPEAVLKELELR